MMQSHFFEPRGIAYRSNRFQPARPTLVLLHGLSGSSSAWFLFERAFMERYNLISIDLRGHGRSRKPGHYRDYALGMFAKDVEELLTHLEIKKCVLVSHSFGTLIALEYLMTQPNRVAATIFLSPNYGIHRTWRARLSWPCVATLTSVVNLFPSYTCPGTNLDYVPYVPSGDWNMRRMYADISNTTLRVYFFCLKHTYAFDRDGWWARIHMPTLIVHGKDDSVVPVAHALQLAAHIPGSLVELLPGAGHIVVLNNAPEIIKPIEDFISGLPRPSLL